MSRPAMEDLTQLSRRCARCGTALADGVPDELCPTCAETHMMEETMLSDQRDALAGQEGRRFEDGEAFGPYTIIRRLGSGGMGDVYEAEHRESRRHVALKVLRGQLRSHGDRARFLREGQLAASISHPHTVYVYGSEEIAGKPVISMELLPGGTLKDRVVAEGPMPPTDAAAAVLEMIGGLDAAHAAGILHRDIKPSNCFNDADGTIKVGDFGLSISTLARDVRQRMQAGGFEGTPQFAAPEQLRGQALDVRADIYAVGATLYYLLTGRPPFEAPDLNALVHAVSHDAPVSPRQLQPAVPAGLAAVVLKCLAKNPAGRPASYAELATALQPFSSRQDVAASPGLRVMAGLVDAVVVGILAAIVNPSGTWGVSFESGSGESFDVNEWATVTGVLYFFLAEGRWGASIGKRLFGLRVTSAGAQPSWKQIGVRTLTYYASSLILAVPVFVLGGAAVESWVLARPVVAALATLLPTLYFLGLFLPARRHNGWAALHDRVSGTRVVLRAGLAARSARRVDVIQVTPLTDAVGSGARVGPFDVTADLGPTTDGRLLLGFDAVLRRRVWIHSVPPGTPEVSPARRSVRRAGRLHWLAGQRSGAENWDAFEAPDGAPASCDGRVPWASAKRALLELADELAAAAADGTLPHLSADRVWIRDDGRALLLDFPAPGARAPRDNADAATRTPAGFLAQVTALEVGARPAADMLLPLSVSSLLADWSAGRTGSLDQARSRLIEAVRVPEQVSRFQRALPILLASVPILLLTAGSAVALQMVRSFDTSDNIHVVRLLSVLPERSPETREALETYLAGRYRAKLEDDGFWNSVVMQGNLGALREPARQLLAAHPAVSAADMERVAPLVTPELTMAEEWYEETIVPGLALAGSAIVGALAGISLVFVIINALISTAIVRGGAVFRLIGLAVVTREGREAGRGRSIVRVLVAWSPAVIWMLSLGSSPVDRILEGHTATVVGLGVALGVMAVGAAWSVVARHQGPHDWITRTRVVPR